MDETGARNRPKVIQATITGKNQITIPAVVVRELQLEPGMQLEFQIAVTEPKAVIIRPVESREAKVRRLEGILRPYLQPGDDPIGDLIREREQDDIDEGLDQP